MKSWQADLVLLSLAVIWGTTFPFLKVGVEQVGPLNFLGYRYLTAAALLALFFIPTFRKVTRNEIIGGTVLGFFLSLGNIFQAVGIEFTTASKTGFITGLYIPIIPILAKFILKTKISPRQILATLIAIVGLYFLSVTESFTLTKGDLWVLGCPFAYAFQMVYVNYYGEKNNPINLNIFQLLTVGVVAIGLSFPLEGFQMHKLDIKNFWILIYLTTVATVLVFTLHLYVQPKTNPVRAGLILSLEAVFSAFFSFMWLGEQLTARETVGACLMMGAIFVSEVKWKKQRRKSTA